MKNLIDLLIPKFIFAFAEEVNPADAIAGSVTAIPPDTGPIQTGRYMPPEADKPVSPPDSKDTSPSVPPEEKSGEGEDKTEDPAPEKSEGEVEIDDGLLDNLGFESTPEEELKSAKAQLSASTREAQRLNENLKALQGDLEKQGLNLNLDTDGKYLGITPGENFGKGKKSLDIDFNKLPQELQDKAFDNQQDFVDQIVAMTVEQTATPAPTKAKATPSLSKEQRDVVLDRVKSRTLDDGKPLIPIADKLNSIITKQVDDKRLFPEALREAYNAHPVEMTEMLMLRAMVINERRAAFALALEKEKAKEKEADKEKAGMAPEGSGSAHVKGEAQQTMKDAANAIAGAYP